ncbi:MAG: bifunctional metallophosphatase/5'-nucleotidase [Pseudomonadota bacterium]
MGRWVKASLLSALLTLTAAPGMANTLTTQYATDPELKAQLAGIGLSWGTLKLRFRLKNTSHTDIVGKTRVVVDSAVAPWVADGVTDDGLPFFEICGERRAKRSRYYWAYYRKQPPSEDCGIRAGGSSERVTVLLPLRKFLRNPKLSVAGEFQPFTLQLLHNADMDSNSNQALENVARFSGLLERFRAEAADNTVVLSSGDNYIPGPRYNAAAEPEFETLLGVPGVGRLDIAFLNAMGYEASAVGNHELDGGPAEFASIFAPDGAYPGALFPYLSSNLVFSSDAALAPFVAEDGQVADDIPGSLAGTGVIEVDGQRIGIVGAVTPTLGAITNEGDITVLPEGGDVDIPALANEIQQAVDALTLTGIDKVIVLAHMQQISVEFQLAQLLRDVDIIVAGGSNTRLLDENDRVRPGDTVQGNYPEIFSSASGEPVLVVNTDGDYKYLGRLVSLFTLAGAVNVSRLDDEVNGGYATDEASYEAFGSPAPDATVVDLAATADAVLQRINTPIGLTEVFLSADRSPGVRTEETTLGNLTADANLAAAKLVEAEVVVSIKNGGGIRASIGDIIVPPGGTEPVPVPPPNNEITRLAIESTLAFNNGLTLLTLTAAELVAVLEHGVNGGLNAAGNGLEAEGRFPQVAGVSFSYDPRLPSGSRIVDAVIEETGEVLVSSGNTVGTGPYRIVTLGFLAGGGDGFPFPQGPAANLRDLEAEGLPAGGPADFAPDGSEQDALAEYLITTFPLDGSNGGFNQVETTPDADARITNLAF